MDYKLLLFQNQTANVDVFLMDLKPPAWDPDLPRPPYFLRQEAMAIEGYKITKLSDLQQEAGTD